MFDTSLETIYALRNPAAVSGDCESSQPNSPFSCQYNFTRYGWRK